MHAVVLLMSLWSPAQTIDACPAWESDRGAFETGLIAVPTDRSNAILDVFSATGNDCEAATVLSWQNRTRRGPSGPFSWTITDPSWTSNDVGLRTDLAAGRFDGDDLTDLVVLDMLGSPSLQGRLALSARTRPPLPGRRLRRRGRRRWRRLPQRPRRRRRVVVVLDAGTARHRRRLRRHLRRR